MNPQSTQVLNLLKRDGNLTRLTAMHYGIANVTARIADLRRAGYRVTCTEKRDAAGRRYGVWRLAPTQVVAPPATPDVGTRIRIVNKQSSESVYSEGAEGVVIRQCGFPNHPIAVRFDTGNYDHTFGAAGGRGAWFVHRDDFVVVAPLSL